MTALPDDDARRRIRDDLAATLFVEAAAGTGKTTALVSRLVALLCSGRATLPQIAAVTFTEKAAGEMKLRVREEIEQSRAAGERSADERARLDAALEHLELARIGTIHAFCGDLLHERPVEAGVDPLFEVAAEDEARALLDAAFDAWFERVLSDPPEGVRRVLRRRPTRADDGGPRAALRRAVDALVDHRDFSTPWRRDPFDRQAALDAAVDHLARAAPLAQRGNPRDYLAKAFAEIARWVEENRLRESVRGRDYDALEASLRQFAGNAGRWRWRGWRSDYAPGVSRAEARGARDAVKAELDALVSACDADLSPLLREELRPVVEAYEAAKARRGRLDFLDLLLRARDLVRDDASVRREFQRRFSHFFVDEFQDTDPLQAELLLLLAADDPAETDAGRARPVPGKLFLVGDPKQSIYRFRRADVSLYERVKRQLVERGAELVQLSASFRARPSLQGLVNAAFGEAMRGSEDGSQADYVALEPVRGEGGGQPGVVVLPVPRPYGDYGTIVKWRIDDSFPDAVGAFVHWLVARSGWTVEEPGGDGVRVPVAPRHVCILLRRFQSFGDDVTRPYVRALEARRVAHVLVGGRSFHEREEVLALRNALVALEWPDDELRVFATLRGPFFALHDDALLAFRAGQGRLHPLRWPDPEAREALPPELREVADALAVLSGLHRRRNRRPVADTISRLLEAVRAHAGIAIWPTGEQALANCLRSVDLARRFERRGAPSFRAFVEHLEAEAERGQSEDAPVVEEGTEGVRIMTVHRAKGLEFPVVILADPTCNAVGARPSRHVDPERGLWAEPLCGSVPPDLRDAQAEEIDRDRHESVRLAYVAATRARDLLVLPGLGDLDAGDDEARGWLEALVPALYPEPRARRRPAPPPACPAFGDETVIERSSGSSRSGPAPSSIRPGLHRGALGGQPVVWWDPASLELDVQEEVGLRQQAILEADAEGVAASAGVEAHARWQAARAQALAQGSRPSLRVESVTALAAAGEAAAPGLGERGDPVRVEEVAGDRRDRPGGRRFGTLVHAALAAVDLEADAATVRACTRVQGRLVGALEEEVRAAEGAVAGALAHPLVRRAAVAAGRGELRRETPVLLRLPDGGLAEGVVDLAFREGEGRDAAWTVVDWKTDRELGDARPRYEAQLRLYAEGVARATGEPARGVLMVV